MLLHGEMGKVGWEDLLEGKLYKKKVGEINNHMDVLKSYKESYYFMFTYILLNIYLTFSYISLNIFNVFK